ncbi:MAG: hypothetical protein MK078_00875 [Crocinitomicaceae bacterium]|nr:hypothetical protein [Crocinitomicaceae bacterium]
MQELEDIETLKLEINELKTENEKLKDELNFLAITKTVTVPDQFKEIFVEAENNVRRYFTENEKVAQNGEITINGERYLLIRSAALSYEFMDVFRELYANRSDEEALAIGQNFLFDIAHVLGKEDAKAFHKKMDLKDPIQKLSAGPIHFAYTGWANVEILPESNPSPDENFFLKYHHHNSFEAQSWIKAGRKPNFPVCIMNTGYSSGWCAESFGIPLTAVEISCEAKGDDSCTFIMAPPDRIQEYLEEEKVYQSNKGEYDVPVFFQRKYNEEQLRESLLQKEILFQEVHHRVKNNLQIITSMLRLQANTAENESVQRSLNDANQRIRAISQVHERLYKSSDLGAVSVHEYTEGLAREIIAGFQGNKEVDLNISTDNSGMNLVSIVPLALILNELIMNSLRHAFKAINHPMINIDFKQDNESSYLKYLDNGNWVENDQVDSFGTSLIDVFTEQLEGKYVLDKQKGRTEYSFTFKNA